MSYILEQKNFSKTIYIKNGGSIYMGESSYVKLISF